MIASSSARLRAGATLYNGLTDADIDDASPSADRFALGAVLSCSGITKGPKPAQVNCVPPSSIATKLHEQEEEEEVFDPKAKQRTRPDRDTEPTDRTHHTSSATKRREAHTSSPPHTPEAPPKGVLPHTRTVPQSPQCRAAAQVQTQPRRAPAGAPRSAPHGRSTHRSQSPCQPNTHPQSQR